MRSTDRWRQHNTQWSFSARATVTRAKRAAGAEGGQSIPLRESPDDLVRLTNCEGRAP